MDNLATGMMDGLVVAGVWFILRAAFGRKRVAEWKWQRRGFYKGYWFFLYYFALIAAGASIAYREWLAAGIFGAGYWLMSRQEKEIASGAAFRRAYVKEAGEGQ